MRTGALPRPPPSSICELCCFLLLALPGSKAQGRGAFKYRTSQGAGADGGAGGGKESPTLGPRPSPLGFHDQGHCAGRKEEQEEKGEVQGSFWYQGRKTLWEEVVCRG